MSNLCATQHSPSAWANFVPKLTSTLTVTEKQQNPWHNSCLHYLPSLLTPSPWNTATPSDNTALPYKSLRMSTSHFMMLGYPQLLERAEGRQDGSSYPYWELSIVTKRFYSLKRSAAVFRSPTSLARRTDKDSNSENNCTVAVRSAVTVGSLPQRVVATLATAAAALWHGHQLIPMKFSAELDCFDLLALVHQPKAP